MGITDLWSILAPGFDERVSFPIVVSKFIEQYGRTPKLAIDGYMFIFQSNHSNLQSTEREHDIQIRNIMSKLMYLTLLNVSYVVVLDGSYKPNKLRHGEIKQGSMSYDYQLDEFRKIAFDSENYTENSAFNQLISQLKEVLKANQIDFIQCPGEAEAECARLQKFGVVDFVLTKDTDVFVFGATKVLRNFSRSEKDVAISSSSKSVKEYYVTPVDMENVTRITGLDYKRLILIATLKGGDYSNGMSNIGITRATSIALCGTKFAKFYHLSPRKTKKNKTRFIEPLPDFSELLIDCFVNRDCVSNFDPFSLIKDSKARKEELEKFIRLLNHCIKTRPRDIFDMEIKFSSELFIDEYFTLLYLFPIVSPKLFKFFPYTLSFAETKEITDDLTIPKFTFPNIRESRNWVEDVPRFNNIFNKSEVGYLRLHIHSDDLGNIKVSSSLFIDLKNCCERRPTSIIPNDFKFNIKSIIIKIIFLFRNHPKLYDIIKITNIKSSNDIEFVMLKFDSKSVKNEFLSCLDTNLNGDIADAVNLSLLSLKDILDSIWLPRNLLQLVNLKLIEKYEMSLTERGKGKVRKISKRPKAIQHTTLDSLGFTGNMPSLDTIENRKIGIMPSPPHVRSEKLSKLRKPTSRKKFPLPGQAFVTAFFPKKSDTKRDNPFIENNDKVSMDSSFMSKISDIENESIQLQSSKPAFNDLKLGISFKPNLHYDNYLPNSEASNLFKNAVLPQLEKASPRNSKERYIKENLYFSPDISPIRQNSIIGENIHESSPPRLTLPITIQDEQNVSKNKEIKRTDSIQATTREATICLSPNIVNSPNTEITEVNDSDSGMDSSIMEISFSSFYKKLE